nr:tRNA-binding protein [Legionella tunisiensis]
MTISYDDFARVDIRSGTVVEVKEFSRAKKPAYKVWVDFGPEIGILQTSAQVTAHYTPESLLGRLVVGCVNLGEKILLVLSHNFYYLVFLMQRALFA